VKGDIEIEMERKDIGDRIDRKSRERG